MICNNCGKQIKDFSKGQCLNCGQDFYVNFEGNGFYDILLSEEERQKMIAFNDEREQLEMMNEQLITELTKAQNKTNKLLKGQLVFKVLAFVALIALVCILLLAVLCLNHYGEKLDTINKSIAEMQAVETPVPEEKKEEITTGIKEAYYNVELVDLSEENGALLEVGKQIMIGEDVFGEITEKAENVITVKTQVLVKEAGVFLDNNWDIRIKPETEMEFTVDGAAIKGILKEKNN